MRMMIWRRLRESEDEQGVVMVIVVLSIVAIFAMVVLTIDVGGLLLKRRALVNGSDAAALAAAESCALGANHVFTNVPGQPTAGTPESRADQYAVANVDGDLNSAVTNIVAAQTTNCTTTQPNPAPGPGHVTVAYQGNQPLYFAQVLGLGSSSVVGYQSTAAWGPTGSGNPIPIVLNLSTFQGNCDIPNAPMGTTCYLWYDNDRFNGSAFGFMDLNHWGVAANYNCPAAGASDLDAWINDAWSGGQLPSNYPSPTYVCSTSGNRDSDWTALQGREGDILTFPINDQNNEIDCCGGQVDKYDVIGFAALQLDHVYDANDPAINGSSGSCSYSRNFPNASPLDTVTVGQFPGNCAQTIPATWSASGGSTITNIQLKGNRPSCCTLGSDYTVTTNASGHPTVTWTSAAPHDNITVSYNWSIPGPCGPPPSNNSSHCIVVEWQGAQIGGGNPGGGIDLGMRSIRLCDPSLSGSCPAGS